jgi:transcriptional regulator with XRE-family HTH domain
VSAFDVAQGLGWDSNLGRDLIETALVGLKSIQGNVKNVSHTFKINDISPVVKRQIAFNFRHTDRMSSREIFGANLSALMHTNWARQKSLSSNKKVGDKLQISDNTVGRIRRGENSIGIDMLDKTAHLYGLQAWQMLVSEFDPDSPPMLRAMNEHERALYERLHAALKALEAR